MKSLSSHHRFLRDPSLREMSATFVDGAEPTFGASLAYCSVPKPGRIWAGIDFGPFHVAWQAYVGDLAAAVLQTIEFTVAGFLGAVIIGLVVALLRLAPLAPFRAFARVYTGTFKNLPLVTEIFLVYFGLATIGIVLNVFVAGAISLAILYGADLSEIFRGGLQGVTSRHVTFALTANMTATTQGVRASVSPQPRWLPQRDCER